MSEAPTLEECERAAVWLSRHLANAEGCASGGDAVALRAVRLHADALCGFFALRWRDPETWARFVDAIERAR